MPGAAIADGLNPHREAAGEALPATGHVRKARIAGVRKGKGNDGRAEMPNGAMRDREKAFGGLQGSRAGEFCGLRTTTAPGSARSWGGRRHVA